MRPSNGFMTRLGLELNILRVDLCCEMRLGFVTCGGRLGRRFWVCLSNSIRLVKFGTVEGLQYVGHLVVRGSCLRWNCFFIVWLRLVVDF